MLPSTLPTRRAPRKRKRNTPLSRLTRLLLVTQALLQPRWPRPCSSELRWFSSCSRYLWPRLRPPPALLRQLRVASGSLTWSWGSRALPLQISLWWPPKCPPHPPPPPPAACCHSAAITNQQTRSMWRSLLCPSLQGLWRSQQWGAVQGPPSWRQRPPGQTGRRPPRGSTSAPTQAVGRCTQRAVILRPTSAGTQGRSRTPAAGQTAAGSTSTSDKIPSVIAQSPPDCWRLTHLNLFRCYHCSLHNSSNSVSLDENRTKKLKTGVLSPCQMGLGLDFNWAILTH